MTVVNVRMARVTEDDLKHLWRLFRAAQLAEWETRRQEASQISFAPDFLTREEIFFFRCAWRACIDTGALSRLLGGYDTLFLNFADPGKDYLDFKPSLREELEKAALFDVLLEAYEEARAGESNNAQPPIAWINEDELPTNYPYDAMYPHSSIDVVRMFPVFGPAVVPGEMNPTTIRAVAAEWDRELDDDEANVAADSWNACRAAMLNGE